MPESEERTVEIKWSGDMTDLPTIYANTVFVSHAGAEFFIVFGEYSIPYPIPEDLATVSVRPVAKIAISREAMLSVERIINKNVAIYKKKFAIEESDEENEDDNFE